MLTKCIFVIIDCLAVLGLYFTIRALDNVKEGYRVWLKHTLYAGMVAIFANMLAAVSFNYASAGIAFSIYFGTIDWILYFLAGFCISYTEHERALKHLYIPAAVILGADSVSMLLNTLLEHEFYVYVKTIGDIRYYQIRAHFPYYIHLALDYIAIIFALVFILVRIARNYSFYRTKYVIILSVLMLVVLLNVAYMALQLPLDASVVFYAVAGTLIYFSIQRLVPQGLMTSSMGRAVDDMNEGLILFDITDHCIYVNEFARSRFGLDPDTCDLESEPLSSAIRTIRDSGEEFGEARYTRDVSANGSMRTEYYIIRYNRLNEKKGRKIGSYFLLEDNTEQTYFMNELKAARDQANEASSAKSSFLASMSHEIRTPLNSVLGLNEMILRTTDDPQLRDYAENIKISGDSLLSLINDILDFSKIEARRMDIIPVEYDPHRLLRDCYNNFIQMAEAKDLYIEISCDELMPSKLKGDEKLIRQIMSNLISNAIKYTKTGGVKIELSDEGADPDKRDLVIAVSDTGIGIASDEIKYLFEAFRRINEKENATIQGTGLGLAITKELVTLMHGTISVQSAPGQGSTFTIVLPQEVTDAAPIGDFEKAAPVSEKKYKESFNAPDALILVVDDAKLNLKVARALLKDTQIQVDTADGGLKAIEMCRTTKYDVILLDHRMPDPDGIQTYKEISAEGMNTDTPVIMLTANVISGAEEEYKKIGFCDYLSKPIRGEDLEAALAKHLPPEKVIRSGSKES